MSPTVAFGLSMGALLMASSASAAAIERSDAVNGDLAKVRAAVEAGADVNAPVQDDDVPPLHVAAEHGEAELARYLVAKGARLESDERYGRTPLEGAAEHGGFKLALWLLDAAPKPSQDYLERAFRAGIAGALRATYDEEMKPDRALALAGRAVERGLPRDGPCVRKAVHESATIHADVVMRWLVEVVGASPDLGAEAFPPDHRTRFSEERFGPPIVDAARHGSLETVRYLVGRGIDPNKSGGKPLFAATFGRRPEVVAFLLANGAKPDVRDDDGHTPLYHASRDRDDAIVKAFLAAGVKLEPSEEAELAALRAELDRERREQEARWAAQARQRRLLNLAIKIPLLLLWVLYLAASIRWRGTGPMSTLNLVAGPVLAGVGAGLIVGFAFMFLFSYSHGGYGAIADGTPVGVLVGLVTTAVLGVLFWRARADIGAHPWLYYAGPALSAAIPATLSIIRFGK